MQEIIHGLKLDREWERALTSIRWWDQRRPWYLDDQEIARIETSPGLEIAIREYTRLEDEFECNPDPSLISRLEPSKRNVTNTRQRLRYKRHKKVRQKFGPKQATCDINKQLSESIVRDDNLPEDPQMEDIPPGQMHLVEALLAVPTKWILETVCQRCSATVDATVAYCSYEEGSPLRGRPKGSVSIVEEREQEDETI
ncbi:hypothetical protein Plec18170_009698 [Paecilomyces lecythidis]